MAKKVILVGIIILLIIVFFIFARYGYPLFRWDAGFFIPTAINLAAGKGLINEFYPVVQNLDPLHQYRFIANVPLFPVVLSLLIPHPSPQGAYVALAILHSLALSLSGLLLYRTATLHGKPLGWMGTGLISLSLLGMATHFVGRAEGRPETLGVLFFLLAVLTIVYGYRWRFLWVPLGGILGLMGATHPVGGIMLFLMLGLYFAIVSPPREAIRAVLGVGLLSIACFFIMLKLASPYPLADMFQAIAIHAQLSVDYMQTRDKMGDFLNYHFLVRHQMFYGLLFVGFLAACGHLYRCFRNRVRSAKLFGVLALALAGAIFKTSIWTSASSYNLYMFTPLFFGVILYATLHGLEALSLRRQLMLKCTMGLVLGLTTLGFFQSLILFPAFMTSGLSLNKARLLFQQIETSADVPIGVSSSLWVLSENYNNMFLVNGFGEDRFSSLAQKKRALIVLQQYSASQTSGKASRSHVLYRNYFTHEKPSLFGIHLSATMPSYQFAVYVPKHAPWKKHERFAEQDAVQSPEF